MTMCTRFVYRGDNIITGFNFDIDIVEWNHKVINTKDCFYIGIMRPDGMRHSYHGVNRNGNVGTLLYVHGNLSGTYQDSKDCITIADLLQNLTLAQIGMTDLPDGAFEMGTLVRFAGYSFLTSMPVLSFMLLISSRFENMWVPLGIGVAGFLSGMALANSGLTLLLVHPFVIILKPAVAMSAQTDSTVALVALVETLLFLAVGLWLAKYRRYE